MKKILITGTAGFIGYHLADLLLLAGFSVHGYDGMTAYYDVDLKKARHKLLFRYPSFTATEGMLQDQSKFDQAVDDFVPDVIIHLAAQAGVRHSLENPRAYLDSNVIGTFNVMEAARRLEVRHLLMASTSSVYGANTKMPFVEREKTDTQLTIYAATKKATESMGHAYAHIYNIPTTMFRFFTVYGPWGRPDMALFKFTKNILAGKPIDVYNNGEMWRDFTYVGDLVQGIRHLVDAIPGGSETAVDRDSLSNAAPFRVVNIGNSESVKLTDFIKAIEEAVGKKAIYNYMPMQTGDVQATYADSSLIKALTDFQPSTPYKKGVLEFANWYQEYYSS